MLAYARSVGMNYVLYPQSTHAALMTAGQDNGQEMEPDAYTLWHRRLGHVGEEKVRLLQTNVEGIPALVPG